jgi:hypothetical protein
MGTFNENLDLRWGMENGVMRWTLLTPFAYKADNGHVYEAPSGFQTDLASIPRIFWTFLPPFWKYAKAAVIHDWIIDGLGNPELANEVFREDMVSVNVNNQQVWIIYKGVCMHFWFKSIIKKR